MYYCIQTEDTAPSCRYRQYQLYFIDVCLSKVKRLAFYIDLKNLKKIISMDRKRLLSIKLEWLIC